MTFALIAAVDKNFGIGKNGRIPWNLQKDTRFFRDITVGNGKNAVIMGRATWESLPPKHKPLKKRLNIILTRGANYALPKTALKAQSLDEALEFANQNKCEKAFVIGGSQIYALAAAHPNCAEIYLTEILGKFDCDAFFPKIDAARFKKTSESEICEEKGIKFRFAHYKTKY